MVGMMGYVGKLVAVAVAVVPVVVADLSVCGRLGRHTETLLLSHAPMDRWRAGVYLGYLRAGNRESFQRNASRDDLIYM